MNEWICILQKYFYNLPRIYKKHLDEGEKMLS